MKGETLKLQIFDTVFDKLIQAGQEAFHSLPKSYYRESAAIIIVYDVTEYLIL